MILPSLPIARTASDLVTTTFRSLRHRNYRLFFLGQLVSLIGTWLENTAFSWLVYSLTKDSMTLGIMGFLGSVPVLFLSVIAGTIADEHPKRKLLIITQAAAGGISIALAGYLWTGNSSIIIIGLARFILGAVTAFDLPTRQAFVVEMASKEDLTNAVALNSAVFNGARLIGPAFAGYIIASVSMTMCFFLNGVSFLAVIIGLVMMRFDHVVLHKRTKEQSRIESMKEGLRYLNGIPQLKALMGLVIAMTLFGWSYTVNLPVVAGVLLKGGSSTFSALLSANGAGALLAALSQAAFAGKMEPRRMIFIGLGAFAASLLFLSYCSSTIAAVVVLVLTGWGIITFFITANTTLQRRVPDELRGRVMGIYSLSFAGLFPFGSLLAGYLADVLGVADALRINAAILAICAIPAYLYVRRLPRLSTMPAEEVQRLIGSEQEIFEQEQISRG
jgi:MFS family permease